MSFKKIILFISALSLVIMLLLNAVSLAIFGNREYFRKEFEKYNVTDNIDMRMDDIMYVMDELMDYLHGDRDNIENIVTEVNGETRDFFSDREKIHMADCRVIFDSAFKLRTACTVLFIVSVLLLKAFGCFDIRKFLRYAGGISIFIIVFAVIIEAAAAVNFNACFVMFHKLFFDNDLWLLNPEQDMIINILVEPFFADMALKIALYCGFVLLIIAAAGIGVYIKDKKRRKI